MQDAFDFKCPFISKNEIWDCAEEFRTKYLPESKLPIDIEAVVEKQLSLNIEPLPGLFADHLFRTCYFHGSISSAELNIRGWALIYNFAPSNTSTVKKHNGLKSPAEKVNKFCYHENWLKNLLISASLGGGFRCPPLNPL